VSAAAVSVDVSEMTSILGSVRTFPDETPDHPGSEISAVRDGPVSNPPGLASEDAVPSSEPTAAAEIRLGASV